MQSSVLFFHIVGLHVTVAQFNPHFVPNRSVIVQLFEWKFTDIERECVEFLGPHGFGGVQVSPVSENVVRKDAGRPWWERYHPISYKIASRSGCRNEFLAMTKACNAAGVRVYVDAVFNHMGVIKLSGIQRREMGSFESNEEIMIGTGGSTADARTREYPAVPFKSEHFHKSCPIDDLANGYAIRVCELMGRPDINHSLNYTRDRISGFLDELVELGAAGFFIDSAEHMWPWLISVIIDSVRDLNTEFGFPRGSRPFALQEVFDLEMEGVSKTEYAGYGALFEPLYPVQITAIFDGPVPLSSLVNWGPTRDGFLPQDVVVSVDSVYFQRGQGSLICPNGSCLNYKKPKSYIMATAFMLAHPYGIKRIMSSFRFEERQQGPPTIGDEDDTIASPEFDENGQCIDNGGVTQWVCEHRWNPIVNMVAFASYVADEDVQHFQIFAPNHVAFCRGDKGFILLNNDPKMDLLTSVYACLEPGDYCDAISGVLKNGSCTGHRITVNEDRMALVSLPAHGGFGVLATFSGFRVI